MFFEGGLADCKTYDSEISIGNNGSTSTSIPATPKNQVGVLVTAELDKALKSCKEKVERIARDCRAQNKKFRYVQGSTRFFKKNPHHLSAEILNSTLAMINSGLTMD